MNPLYKRVPNACMPLRMKNTAILPETLRTVMQSRLRHVSNVYVGRPNRLTRFEENPAARLGFPIFGTGDTRFNPKPFHHGVHKNAHTNLALISCTATVSNASVYVSGSGETVPV